MSDWKVLLADRIADAGKQILLDHAQVDDCPEISAEELQRDIGHYDAMVVRSRTQVTEALLKRAGRMKVVGRMGVGVDNIDLDAARSAGITVVNSPNATTIAVAELTMALMLDLARKTPRADGSMKKGHWDKKTLRGTELFGKTLGIIGIGRIGRAVAKRASGFGMRILGYDAFLTPDRVRENGAEPVSLDALYRKSDYISLHVPLTGVTRGMISAQTLERMKDGVHIVCAARGGVIDEAALLEALESGKVAGAGLDVFEVEPPGASPLVSHPRVITTPHIGAQTEEAQDRAAVDIATEILRALEGQELRWRVA